MAEACCKQGLEERRDAQQWEKARQLAEARAKSK